MSVPPQDPIQQLPVQMTCDLAVLVAVVVAVVGAWYAAAAAIQWWAA